jgi:DNA-binding PucR family transcriptional regulator
MPSSLKDRLKGLGHIASLVNSGTELSDVLRRIAMAVCQRSLWSSSAIMALDRTSGYSVLVARHDPYFETNAVADERWLLETSPTRQVLEAGTSLVIADAQEAADYPGYQRDARQRDYRTVVLLPLQATDERGRAMVMSVHAHERRTVEPDELVFLETAARLASLAVEKAHLLRVEQQQVIRLRQTLDVHATSMEQVLAGGSLSSVLEIVAARLPYPLLLVDLTTNQALAQGSPVPTGMCDAEWASIVAQQGARAFAHLLHSMQPSRFSSRRRIGLAPFGFDVETEAFVEPLVVDDVVLGGLMLFTDARDLDAFDALVAEEARFALTVQLMRAHVRFITQAETHGEFFGRLFSGNWRDRTETLERAGHLGLAVDMPARLAVLTLAPEDRFSLPANRRADLLRSLLRTAGQRTAGVTAFFDGDAFVVFLPQTAGDETSAELLVQRLIDEIAWISESKPIAVLSRLCTKPEDYQAARQDCSRLLELGQRVGRRGMVKEADFGPLAQLLAAADRAELRRFVTDTLGAIELFDRQHRSDFLPTLDTFLTHLCRYQACADALGIHVTTLRYRLKRLNELFGVDLDAPDTRLALLLALRIRGVVNSAD